MNDLLRLPFRGKGIFGLSSSPEDNANEANSKAGVSTQAPSSVTPHVGSTPTFRRAAVGVAAVMFVLGALVLFVSIPHLVQGVMAIAQCSFVTAFFVALVFDLSQLAAEAALLVSRFVRLESRTLVLCRGQILAFTTMSAVLNVKAFREHAVEPFDVTLAWVWGVLLPISVLVLFIIGSSMLLAVAHQESANTKPKKRSGRKPRENSGSTSATTSKEAAHA